MQVNLNTASYTNTAHNKVYATAECSTITTGRRHVKCNPSVTKTLCRLLHALWCSRLCPVTLREINYQSPNLCLLFGEISTITTTKGRWWR